MDTGSLNRQLGRSLLIDATPRSPSRPASTSAQLERPAFGTEVGSEAAQVVMATLPRAFPASR